MIAEYGHRPTLLYFVIFYNIGHNGGPWGDKYLEEVRSIKCLRTTGLCDNKTLHILYHTIGLVHCDAVNGVWFIVF